MVVERSQYLLTQIVVAKLSNWNSRLCSWDQTRNEGKQTFYNQALNSLYNYTTRGFSGLVKYVLKDFDSKCVSQTEIVDARDLANHVIYG